MTIQEQLQGDLKSAMRGGDKRRVEVIRMALAALKNAQIAQVKQAYDASEQQPGDNAAMAQVDRNMGLSETAMQETLAKEVKRRREAALIYRQANREDLAVSEDEEAGILEEYLPRQLTLDELRPLVETAIAELGASEPSDISKVMPALMKQFKGRADGRLINQIARETLNKGG